MLEKIENYLASLFWLLYHAQMHSLWTEDRNFYSLFFPYRTSTAYVVIHIWHGLKTSFIKAIKHWVLWHICPAWSQYRVARSMFSNLIQGHSSTLGTFIMWNPSGLLILANVSMLHPCVSCECAALIFQVCNAAIHILFQIWTNACSITEAARTSAATWRLATSATVRQDSSSSIARPVVVWIATRTVQM